MSGGHFNYAYFRIGELADDLKFEIENNDNPDKDEWGDSLSHGYSKQTVTMLWEAQKTLQRASELARAVEWLYSGDTGEESFKEAYEAVKGVR